MKQCQYHNQLSPLTKAKGALVGAAVGDALGWPQEFPKKRLDPPPKNQEIQKAVFQEWKRRSGNRYFPYEELIRAGEYSDDTQLLLCTARSLLYGEKWYGHFTQRELPLWTKYERGGGGATKRAVKSWLEGTPPWLSDKKDRYFEAGGNGVAMRILPHCIWGMNEDNFQSIAQNIILNGIATHGHPRALLGGLVYGYAVWLALKKQDTLPYGELIQRVILESEVWSKFPDHHPIMPKIANFNSAEYKNQWEKTIEEIQQLLQIAQEGLSQGALSIEKAILEKIGCFGKEKGSGTITSIASIFLASSYAVEPINGLKLAAFSQGSDTDTLASMTGGILGAIKGIEWLGELSNQIQDAQYLSYIPELLLKHIQVPEHCMDYPLITKKDIDNFLETLQSSQERNSVILPDQRQAIIIRIIQHQPLSQSTVATSWMLDTKDHQLLYITKLFRKRISDFKPVESQNKLHLSNKKDKNQDIKFESVNAIRLAVRIPVIDLQKSKTFYEQVFGLKVDKETDTLVTFSGIVLVQLNLNNQQFSSHEIYIEVQDLEAAYRNIEKYDPDQKIETKQRYGRRYFNCFDPDKNKVEVIEIDF
ncbi:ADP-ribosylglycohydrolase family protein [Spirulina sp. CS-785/01]|uniref:ADP-ribosylglycohydrolase family protein n=1 Tax=Spirulina sp. CS-785/01 TaxID=3021716 RepID=UPI00232F1C66|nr:ADP-ribosylglycohydrolase family protein [Spirulina sp. CS-785/01]MDB9315949.1 ADP-ribosylglycohydrolase family protein [Spirulina sp. CS-785/01]